MSDWENTGVDVRHEENLTNRAYPRPIQVRKKKTSLQFVWNHRRIICWKISKNKTIQQQCVLQERLTMKEIYQEESINTSIKDWQIIYQKSSCSKMNQSES